MNYNEEIATIHARKTEISLEKRELELKLTETKNNIRGRGRLPNWQYSQLCDEQADMTRKILALERELYPLNARLREISSITQKASTEEREKVDDLKDSKRDIVVALAAVRDHYQNFSADATRVSSMRQMAAEFVVKLNPIIRGAVNPK